jgi:hypothetical protein
MQFANPLKLLVRPKRLLIYALCRPHLSAFRQVSYIHHIHHISDVCAALLGNCMKVSASSQLAGTVLDNRRGKTRSLHRERDRREGENSEYRRACVPNRQHMWINE